MVLTSGEVGQNHLPTASISGNDVQEGVDPEVDQSEQPLVPGWQEVEWSSEAPGISGRDLQGGTVWLLGRHPEQGHRAAGSAVFFCFVLFCFIKNSL